MRTGYFDVSIPTEHGRVWGAILGYDFCAEHEWGITKLLDRFGVTSDTRFLGMNRRKIIKVAEGLMWVKCRHRQGILLPDSVSLWLEEREPVEIRYWKTLGLTNRKGMYAAWDEESFCITSDDKMEIVRLKQVYEAFLRKDIAIARLSSGWAQGSSLAFIIISQMPKAVKKAWVNTDRLDNRVRREFKRTRIESLLRKKKKGFFALSPRYNKSGELVVWLNPFEQSKYNSGWFTIQDLQDWARDTGKVIKKPDPPESFIPQ